MKSGPNPFLGSRPGFPPEATKHQNEAMPLRFVCHICVTNERILQKRRHHDQIVRIVRNQVNRLGLSRHYSCLLIVVSVSW